MTEEDIRSIYGTTIDALYGYVSRRCDGDRAMAEDVTQETWLRAVRSWRRIGVPEKPLAWLITVARNLMLNERRRIPALPLDAVDADRVIDISCDTTHADAADNAALVRWALERLPTRQRILLEAFHFDRRSTAQIAGAFALSERAVEGRLRRARQNLRRELEAALDAAGGAP